MKTILLALTLALSTLPGHAQAVVWKISYTLTERGGGKVVQYPVAGFLLMSIPTNVADVVNIEFVDRVGANFAVHTNLTFDLHSVTTGTNKYVEVLTITPQNDTGGFTFLGVDSLVSIGGGAQAPFPTTMAITGAAQWSDVSANAYVDTWSGTATLDLIDTRMANNHGVSMQTAGADLAEFFVEKGLTQQISIEDGF